MIDEKIDDFAEFIIKCDLTKMTLKISQPHIITKMNQGFDEDVKSIITFNNPDKPPTRILHNKGIYTEKSKYLQKRYRSGVGLLHYLVKYSQLELSNAIPKLSKCMVKKNIDN